MLLQRRELLKLFGLAAAGSLVGCGARPSRPKRVVVIGAGLAGLACAFELQKLGHDVTVLEAQAQVGGRVRTVREPFTNGLWAEMGAMRIPDNHIYALSYIEQFGLPLIEFAEPSHGVGVPPLYYVGGNRFAKPSVGEPWPLAFTPAEQAAGLEMSDGYLARFAAAAGDPRQREWPSSDAIGRFDDMTLEQHLAALGASADWRKAFLAMTGSYASRASLLQILWHEFSRVNDGWVRTYTIDGGNDRLPRAFASAIEAILELERPVLQIEHGADAVAVTYQSGGGTQTLSTEYLVIAIAFPALRNITIAPAFSPDKTRAIQEVNWVPAGRLAYQTRRRFWRDEVQPGFWVANTDTIAERLWDQSDGLPTEAGLLVSYTHEGSVSLVQRPREARLDLVRDAIKQVFPSFDDELAGPVADCYWQEDPWTGGITPHFLPGQLALYPAMRRREGRVFFAGEHCSPYASWMNGALQSGLSTALAIEDEP